MSKKAVAQIDSVFVRVLDIGAGLSCVAQMPGDHCMVNDAGHHAGQGLRTFQGLSEVIPEGEEIDLLVLSHSDADHQGAVKRIFEAYPVKKVLRGGLERLDTATWTRVLPRLGGHFQKDRSYSVEVHHAYEKDILEGVQGGSGQAGPEYGIYHC